MTETKENKVSKAVADKVAAAMAPQIKTAEDAAVACLREEITDEEYKAYMSHFGVTNVAFSQQFLKGFKHELPEIAGVELPRLDGDAEAAHPIEPIEGTLVKEDDATKATEKVTVTNVDGDPTKTRTEEGHVHTKEDVEKASTSTKK